MSRRVRRKRETTLTDQSQSQREVSFGGSEYFLPVKLLNQKFFLHLGFVRDSHSDWYNRFNM